MPSNSANFTTTIDNPYLPLTPGTTFYYESDDGSETIRFEVTRKTKIVDGVECVVVLDRVYDENGALIEKTYDYFAQDKDGNVWYFGEDVKNYVDGVFHDTKGSWLAGVAGAEAGIIMKASPVPGETYSQENAPGVAADAATVLSLDARANTPYAKFDPTLKTYEFSPLEPALKENKFYAAGLGFVRVKDLASQGQGESLVRIEFDGTDEAETIAGNVGRDILRGHGGNDEIRGLAGDDTLIGGNDADLLIGGRGRDMFQFDFAKESGNGPGARDTIADFRPVQDRIDLSGIDADRDAAGNQGFHFIGSDKFGGSAGELRTKGDGGGMLILGDTDGDRHADFRIKVKGANSLEAGDFVL
ncbi:MAG TPA: M10 family metallopeptidase C-terminal domain-containing protein [Bauldia sp.]|nr:M10 family metallopeptidase C-terminal domain-containing protein [Bauldia sp.]